MDSGYYAACSALKTQTNALDDVANKVACGLLQTADSTLSSVVTALQRAISLGVQGANGTLSNADRVDVAGELSGIQQQTDQPS